MGGWGISTGFEISSEDCPATLEPNQQCAVTLVPTPNDNPGARSATLTAFSSNADNQSVSLSANYAPSSSCAVILAENPSAASGNYWIDPDASGGAPVTQVKCDMSSDGGGWTLMVRLDTNDANRRDYYSSFWNSSAQVGDLDAQDDFLSLAYDSLSFTSIRLRYDYTGGAQVSAWYQNTGNNETLRQNLNRTQSNGNPAFSRQGVGGSPSEQFFGSELRFQTIGNDTDYSRIWYNLVPVAACNQGGSIGHVGDQGSNDWVWEVARGSDLMADDCQHNVYRLGLGSNYDPKVWGYTDVSPTALYSQGRMWIWVR